MESKKMESKKNENTEMIGDEYLDRELEGYKDHIIDITDQHLGALEQLYKKKYSTAHFIYEMELHKEALEYTLEVIKERAAHQNITPINPRATLLKEMDRELDGEEDDIIDNIKEFLVEIEKFGASKNYNFNKFVWELDDLKEYLQYLLGYDDKEEDEESTTTVTED